MQCLNNTTAHNKPFSVICE